MSTIGYNNLYMKLNSKELRDIPQSEAEHISTDIVRRPLYLILENIYDTYNIGGIFRLADALAVSKIYLCGEMETPPNHKIQKASVGTYKIVPWEYKETALEAIDELRKEQKDIVIIAVEQSETSIPYTEAEYTLPCALLVGNETYGVLPETLKAVDQTVEIPMWGVNKSLNVIVSAAIVGYHAITSSKK